MDKNLDFSQQVLEWQAEAHEKGVIQGIAEGTAKAVVNALRLRIGKRFPKKLEQAVLQTSDLTVLDQWLAVAVTADSLDAFRGATGQGFQGQCSPSASSLWVDTCPPFS